MGWMIFVCIIETLIFIRSFFLRKNRFSAITYIWIGITVPLFLYLLKWSALIDDTIEGMFIYIFVWFTLICGFYEILSKRLKPAYLESDEEICITKNGKLIIPTVTFLYFICYLMESKIGTGYFIPSLHHYDDHTISVPLISHLTHSGFAVLALNFYAIKATKKKKYIVYIVMTILLPLMTRYSRMTTFMDGIRLLSLYLFFDSNNIKNRVKRSLKERRARRLLVICVVIIGIVLVWLTNYRMSHFGKYDLLYVNSIAYTGPKWLSFFAPYYGYFPLSFNNLNVNLRRTVTHNYLGLYSFTALTFGILHLHSILGIRTNGHIQGRYVTSTAATVPTGFWDFYYDYDILCFIPMLVAFAICFWILKRASKEKRRLTFRTLYFWFIPTWVLMSFQNVLFASTMIIAGIIIAFVVKRSFIIKNKD